MMKFPRWKTQKQTLNEVLGALQRIESSLTKIQADGVRGHVDITVENLHVEQANLERLVFHLDSLDIQDLSGALNLGNNFGVKVAREADLGDSGTDRASQGSSFGSPLMRTQLLTKGKLTTRWKSESDSDTSLPKSTRSPELESPEHRNSEYRTNETRTLMETKTGYKVALRPDVSLQN